MWGIMGSTIPNLPIHSQARRGKQHQRRRWASGQDETTGIEEFGNAVMRRMECHGSLGLAGFEDKPYSPMSRLYTVRGPWLQDKIRSCCV